MSCSQSLTLQPPLQHYFDFASAPGHAGVAAAEALLALLQGGGLLAREHFSAVAPAGALLRLLDCVVVPARWGGGGAGGGAEAWVRATEG